MARLTGGLWLACAAGLTLAVGGALEPTPAPTTIEAALGGPADPAAAAVLERRRATAVESLTLDCMTRAGLPYMPVSDPIPVVPDADLAPIAWAERWGFGVSTAVGTATDEALPGAAGDPNLDRVTAMSEADRVTYLAALFGRPGRPGCRAIAEDRVRGSRARRLATLEPAMEALRAAVAADPRAIQATEAWRRCLGTAGISADDRQTTVASLVEAIAARVRTAAPESIPGIQAEERRLAVAVARCETAYGETMAPVQATHERPFVIVHGGELEAIRIALSADDAALSSALP